MKLEDRAEFLRIVTGLAAVKPGKPLTTEGLELYWAAMADWSLEEFKQAATHLAMSVEFMPNPYHFGQLRKASAMTAGEAFQKAREIVRRLNPREMISHQSGDARLDAAVRACGGYEALGMCESINIGFFERRFAEHYETISDAEANREAVPLLTNQPQGEPKRFSVVGGGR